MPALPSFIDRATHAKREFLAALEDRGTQARLLERYVGANRETDFGRAHGFAEIRTLRDYRARVPLRAFADLAPWIDRVVAGERRVLTVADPALFLSSTGTTGQPKTFPVTREYLRNSATNMLVYWAGLLEHYPAVGERDDTTVMLYLAPKPFSKWTPTGIPIHNPTCLPADVRSGFPFARAPWFPPPSELSDADRLYYLVRRSAEHDVRSLACLHPSRLQAVTLLLQRDGQRLVDELREGRVLGAPAPPNPARAAELALQLDGSALSPRAVWPRLEVVSCWTGGSFRLYLPEIRERFGADIFPQTSSSSEAGHITLPILREPGDGPLTVQSNFYEFLPVVGGVRSEGEVRGADELELDRTYELVLTTCSGFYRYTTGDVFRVIGFAGGVPRLEFVGRGGVSDMTGEKISEQHVVAALEAALAETRLTVKAATCCASWGRPPRYVFVVEPTAAWSEEAIAAMATATDAALVRQNPRYELKRGFGDLAPASVRVVPAGTFARHREQLIARGLPATQLKDKALHLDGATLELFEQLATTAA